MHLLLHAICSAESPAPEELLGLRDQPLTCIEAARLVAYATVFEQRAPDLNRADMLAHHRLVGELHARLGACLPARFPTWLDDEHALLEILERRSAEFQHGLERIRGRVELAVTMLHGDQLDATIDDAAPGRRYMLERQRAIHASDAARAVSAEIQRELASDVIEARESVAPRPGVALSLALLVPMDAAERIRRLLQDRQGIRILVSGPWPPYTFAVVPAREA